MSDGAHRQGFATRLLHCAQGRVTALRPQIASAFYADPAQEVPLIERIGEIAATPQASPHQSPSRPIEAEPPRSPHQPPSRPAEAAPPRSRPEPEPFRLVPDEQPPVRSAHLRPDPARAESDPEVEANARVPADPPLPGADPRPVASQRRPRVEPPLRFEERRADSLSAAVAQLLGPTVAETSPGAPTPDPRPAADPFATTAFAFPVVPVQAATMDMPAVGPTEPAPLQIHIGELVIAPEPRPPVHETGPRAAWEPPLSLADYRASRSRERG
jgi:hypothetical protein